jgi:CIC family chloride channel protein
VGIGMALAIFALLFFSTGMAAGSGAPGGLFAPMLTLGGAIGLACGGWVEALTGHVPTTYIFAGMGAFVAGCSRTPITAMFLAFALTKDLLILKPILVACLSSFLVARLFDGRSIYERQMDLEIHYAPHGHGAPAVIQTPLPHGGRPTAGEDDHPLEGLLRRPPEPPSHRRKPSPGPGNPAV